MATPLSKIFRAAHWSAALLPLLAACGGGGDGTDVAVTVPDTPPVTPAEPTAVLSVNLPYAISDGDSGDKPKIQRAGDGTLVVIYGDAPDASRLVYDVKAAVERPARDIYVKTCKPDATKSCERLADWSAAVNLSQSSAKTSISTDWKGDGTLRAYPGDIDKANVKTSGPVMVVTWVAKYCPDGDPATAGVQPTVQRAVRYDARANRVVPFSCTWLARSTDSGKTWGAPVQLSSGLRDAIQDSSAGTFDTTAKTGRISVSWQEDPQGLVLGEAEGPGDGASGSNANGGTDVWYAHASVDLSVPATPANDFVLAPAVRLTDNWTGAFGASATGTTVLDGTGAAVAGDQLETGGAAATRPNIGMVGATTVLAYEEKKNSGGAAQGKFIRYHQFTYNAPPATAAGRAGCIISNPARNARRVRFLTQSAAEAGPGGIQLAIFWREGVTNEGGPADIMLRRGMGGLAPASMVPAVDAGCATSEYAQAIALANAPAENLSSRTRTVTAADTGIADGTEVNSVENALAHRGVLRGRDLWVGWSYTGSLALLATQQDNYNFWLRRFDADTGTWGLPRNLTNITDLRINVREPRLFGTPKSGPACPTGNPADPTTTDATACQDLDILYAAWGTQENVDGGTDLGVYITASVDAGATFLAPLRYSTAQGVLFDDDEAAYEAQVVTRPDGLRFHGVWTQRTTPSGRTVVEYASGQLAR